VPSETHVLCVLAADLPLRFAHPFQVAPRQVGRSGAVLSGSVISSLVS
jgi:hypothetical protein